MAWLSRSSAVTPVSPAKSPTLSAAIRPCVDTCAETSRVPVTAERCAAITCVQVATAASFACTRARIAACTAGVRPQMPAVPGVTDPFTPR